jgi:hypothetical protein
LSTTVHIILKASLRVAAKLRTGSQPISLKLTDIIGEQATPIDPGSICKLILDHLTGVEYSSYTMVPSANIKKDTMDYPNSYE